MARAIALVAIVAACVAGSKLLIENAFGLSLEPWARSWMSAAGPAGAAAVVALLAADIFIPVPSSLVMVLSGAAFGLWWGAALAFLGSIAGEWLGFELARRYGSPWAARLVGNPGDVARLNAVLARHGAAAVVVTRALPVVMETMSLVAGASAMRRQTFLWASVLGTAPIVLIYAYAGATARDTGNLVPAMVILVAVAAAAWVWYRASMRSDPPPDGEGPRPL
jgi:uncharacterized membrane protein YdjX (TVP38/TMEM64 family)